MTESVAISAEKRWEILGGVSNLQLAYFLFRFTLGVNIFFHGFMRIATGLTAWVMLQGEPFSKSPLPMWSVHAFLYVLPFIEVILGTLTTLGLYTRWALLGRSSLTVPMTASSVAISIFLLVTGLFFFRRVEQTFADVI